MGCFVIGMDRCAQPGHLPAVPVPRGVSGAGQEQPAPVPALQ